MKRIKPNFIQLAADCFATAALRLYVWGRLSAGTARGLTGQRTMSFSALIALLAVLASSAVAQPQLPAPPASLGGESSDPLQTLGRGMFNGGSIIIIALVLGAFIAVGWALVKKFNDFRNGRADAGDLVGFIIGGVVLCAIVGGLAWMANDLLISNQGFLQSGGSSGGGTP